ncbi:hypothetical protein CSUI_005140 [Cystoisospora suis]|uniref:Uncharacterized protein n=1 Tax=Cystoisospora suis TaxID=483139 RepID=A0A2C6KY40_9APIC|nr:hypothetical protein CSUI_005140 [Cystoisospora suis]
MDVEELKNEKTMRILVCFETPYDLFSQQMVLSIFNLSIDLSSIYLLSSLLSRALYTFSKPRRDSS